MNICFPTDNQPLVTLWISRLVIATHQFFRENPIKSPSGSCLFMGILDRVFGDRMSYLNCHGISCPLWHERAKLTRVTCQAACMGINEHCEFVKFKKLRTTLPVPLSWVLSALGITLDHLVLIFLGTMWSLVEAWTITYSPLWGELIVPTINDDVKDKWGTLHLSPLPSDIMSQCRRHW